MLRGQIKVEWWKARHDFAVGTISHTRMFLYGKPRLAEGVYPEACFHRNLQIYMPPTRQVLDPLSTIALTSTGRKVEAIKTVL